MASQYTRGQLRDVLVEFYSRVDPGRLDSGIDISGMIDWIIYHGSDDMNARLQAKYGTGLNFDMLKQPKAQQSAMHRISMMPNSQLIEQQSKRLDLRAKVHAFYAENDFAKVAQVDTFVEWIEVNGEKAFNELLLKKYGKSMVSPKGKPSPPPPPPSAVAAPAPPAPTPPTPPPKPVAPAPPPRQAAAIPPPPPPPPQVDNAALLVQLTNFYQFHEPDMPNDPEPIANWAGSVGMAVLNEKLMQLYGGNLDTLEEDIRISYEPPPPPPDEEYYESAPLSPPMPDYEPEPVAPPPAPMAPVAPNRPTPPKPPAAPVFAASEPPRRAEPPKKPEPPKLPTLGKPAQRPSITSSASSALPMIPTLTKPAPPAKPAMIQKAVTGAGSKPPPPPKQRKRSPSEGACDVYVLDLSGEGFGVCLCGFNRAAHGAPKVGNRRSLHTKAITSRQDRPCNTYRVDVAGKNFGDCVCGWGKNEHGKIGWTPPVDPTAVQVPVPKAAPVAAPAPAPVAAAKPAVAAPLSKAAPRLEDLGLSSNKLTANVKPIAPPSAPISTISHAAPKGDVVEMEFDTATMTVFTMMVESYVEQHEEDPDEETKVDWASNLACLTKPANGGTRLKVRAKNVPAGRPVF